jgi:hypothetical protein
MAEMLYFRPKRRFTCAGLHGVIREGTSIHLSEVRCLIGWRIAHLQRHLVFFARDEVCVEVLLGHITIVIVIIIIIIIGKASSL